MKGNGGKGCALHNHREEKKNCGKEGILCIKVSQTTRHHSPMTDCLFFQGAERLMEIEGVLLYLASFPGPIKWIFTTCRASVEISNNL